MTVDELMAHAYAMHGAHAGAAESALRSALEQVVMDAQRYRWMACNVDKRLDIIDGQPIETADLTEAQFDAAIDAARKASNE